MICRACGEAVRGLRTKWRGLRRSSAQAENEMEGLRSCGFGKGNFMNERDMTKGTPLTHILLFAGPAFVSILLQQLYNTVDTLIVGRFAGENALSAVGTCASMITVFLGAAVGFSTAASVIVSQYFGAGKKDEIHRISRVAVTFLLVVGLVVTAIGLVFASMILEGFLGVPETILPTAVLYFRIYCLGLFFQFGYNIVAALLRSVGDSKASMYFLLIASLANVALDLLFVGAFHMGAAGAAVATGLSQGLSMTASFIYMNRNYEMFHFGWQDFLWEQTVVGEIFRIGIPLVLQQMIIGIGIMSIQRAVNSFGEEMMASYAVASRVELFVQMPINALQMALATFVGQNIGAGNYDRVKMGTRQTLLTSVSLTAALAVLLILFRSPIISLFGIGAKAAVYCRSHLFVTSLAFIFQAMYLPLTGVFQGAGHSIAITRVALTALSIRVITTYTLCHVAAIDYRIVWLNVIFGFSGACLMAWGQYLKGTWKKKARVEV